MFVILLVKMVMVGVFLSCKIIMVFWSLSYLVRIIRSLSICWKLGKFFILIWVGRRVGVMKVWKLR